MVLLDNPQTIYQMLTPWLVSITPMTLIVVAWKARGFLDKLVNNHLAHFKQDIIDAVDKGVAVETEGHAEIVKAVREGDDRIVQTLLILNKK